MFRALMVPLLVVALLFAGAPRTPAGAAGCAPTLKATLPLTLSRGRPLVELAFDGAPATLLLDTGAERTLLSETAAKRLGLTAHYAYAHAMGGVGGTVNAGEVRPERIAIGGMSMDGFFIAVARVTFPMVGGRSIDGLLGADMLADYDVELDLRHGRARLYMPAACDAFAPPWPAGYVRVAAHKSMHRHLFFPIRVDGRQLFAFIDTGAQISVLAESAAARLGLGRGVLAHDPSTALHGVAGAARGWLHRFDRIEIADSTWTPPPTVVLPMRLDDADMILGDDFLRSHRVWLSYTKRVVFVAPEGRLPAARQ